MTLYGGGCQKMTFLCYIICGRPLMWSQNSDVKASRPDWPPCHNIGLGLASLQSCWPGLENVLSSVKYFLSPFRGCIIAKTWLTFMHSNVGQKFSYVLYPRHWRHAFLFRNIYIVAGLDFELDLEVWPRSASTSWFWPRPRPWRFDLV